MLEDRICLDATAVSDAYDVTQEALITDDSILPGPGGNDDPVILNDLSTILAKRGGGDTDPTLGVITEFNSDGTFTYTPNNLNMFGTVGTPITDTFTYSALETLTPIVAMDNSSTWSWLHPTDGIDPEGVDADFHSTFYTATYDGPTFTPAAASHTGNSMYGYGTNNLVSAVPEIDLGTPPAGSRWSAYLKSTFDLTGVDVNGLDSLTTTILVDDGAIIYINGTEVGRANMDAVATEAYQLAALGANNALGTSELNPLTITLNLAAANLTADANNTIAISLHNGGDTPQNSSDLAFRMDDLSASILPSTGTVTLTLVDGNIAPALGEDAFTTAQDNDGLTVIGNLFDNDGLTDGGGVYYDPLTADLVVDSSGITAAEGVLNVITEFTSPNVGDFTFNPNGRFHGDVTFTYIVTDKDGASTPTTVTLTITDVNDPPVAVAPTAYLVDENTTLTISSATLDPRIAAGATWTYDDSSFDFITQGSGANEGTALDWRSGSFNSTAWETGAAVLGYGDGQVTEIDYGPDPDNANNDGNNKFTTYYFRNSFSLSAEEAGNSPGPTTISHLFVGLNRDDGAAVYLNGERIILDNLSSSNPSNDTFATIPESGADETTFFQYVIPVSSLTTLLIDGTNIIAVEVHQANLTSSDISFDLTLDTSSDYGAPITGNVLANSTDNDNQALTVVPGTVTVTDGILNLNPDGTFTYQPTGNFVGSDTFSFFVNDGTSDSLNEATVTIIVQGNGEPPAPQDDNYPLDGEPDIWEGGVDYVVTDPVKGLLANDGGAGLYDIQTITQPANGTVVLDDADLGLFTYTPNDIFNGVDTFTYTFVPQGGGTESVTANVNITVNDTTTITIGNEVTNDFEAEDDFDIFLIEASAGEHLIFQLRGDEGNDDNELYIRFGAVPTLTEFDFSGVIPDQPGQVIDIANTQAGTYYVMAYARQDFFSPDTYRLRVDNETALTSLTKGVEVTGDFVTRKDFDIYQIEASAGEHLIFQLRGDGGNDDNELYVRFGAVPTLSEFDFAAVEPNQPGQVIELTNAQAGTYYVMAYARQDFLSPDTYRLRVDNDATLPTLTLGDEININFNNINDYGLFRFDSIEGQQLFISTTGTSTSADRFIYARTGSIPSMNTFDYSATEVDQSQQQLQIPSSESGTLYILIYAGDSSSLGQATVVIDDIAFFKHPIDTSFDGAKAVFASDLDGDGDIDFVAAARDGNELAWWEFDPQTSSYTKHLIDSNFQMAASVHAADLDGDGDLDIVAVARSTNEVAWWENDSGEFLTKHVIDTNTGGAIYILTVDLDQDADFDLLVSADSGDEIAWWENDSNGNFVKHTIDSSFDGVKGTLAVDLDADGDLDVLGAATLADEIAWWENDGNENFNKHIIETEFDGAYGIHAADLNGDGLLDIIASARVAGELAWWRNDGDGIFFKQVLATNFDGAESIDTADFDLDGDLDIVATADNEGEISWWENRGAGIFQKHLLDGGFNGASGVEVADLDGDGDVDILATADDGDELAWCENRSLDKLIVAEVTPAPGDATAVFPTMVSVRFGNDVDASSLTSQSFQVVGAGPDTIFGTSDDVEFIADSITYDALSRIAQFEYTAGFSEGEYRVIISDAVRSASGGLLDGDGNYVSFEFDTLPSGDGVLGGNFTSGFFVDVTPPTEPGLLRSFSHAVGQTSLDDTIDITWNAASDDLSGLLGYYTKWDDQAVTDPSGSGLISDATINVESPSLGDGQNHYFHIVAVDRAGNQSAIEHIGPFSIENGGPKVQFISPADKAVELSAPTSIQVGFHDYDVDPTTLTTISFILEGSGGDGTFEDGNENLIQETDGIINYDSVTRVATFVPANPLPEDVYRVKLTDKITDLLGNALNSVGAGNSGSEFVSSFQFFELLEVNSSSITQDTTWRGLILVNGNVTVQSGATLTIEPGSIVKFADGRRLDIKGTLNALGTLGQPVTFTSSKDDSVGGDSNQDGNSSLPTAADWDQIRVSDLLGTAILNHVDIRYADRALRLTAGNADISNTSMRDGNFGIYIYSPFVTLAADNLLVENNRLTGVFARAESSVLLRNATIVGNGFQGSSGWHRAGIHVGGATVTVENSIVAFNANGIDHSGDPPVVTVRNSDFFNPEGKEIQWDSDPGIPDLSSNGNMSVDPLFVDPEMGNYELSAGSPVIDAGKGTDFPLTDILERPRYDDSGIANIGSGAIPYVDMGAFERQENSTPSDLKVTSVAAPSPATVTEGGSFSVSWSISNTGDLPTSGPWEDAVYLSSDTVFDPTDILLGTVEYDGTLAVGASYTASLNAVVPATAGPQNILVRTNHTRAVRESNEVNNIGISSSPLEVNVPTILLDNSIGGTVDENQWQYFRFDATAGNSVRFSVDSLSNQATIGIYVRQGRVPSLNNFDVSTSIFGNPDPEVLLQKPLDETYYIGIYGQYISGDSTNFTLSAESTALSLESLGQSIVGAGAVTLELLGENFSADNEIYLFAPDNVTRVDPLSTMFDNSTLAYATFDFSTSDLGVYDVIVESSTGEIVTLFDALTVESTAEAEFFLDIDFPTRTRPGRKATITLTYGNTGDVDMFSPLLTLISDDDMSWRVPGTQAFITTGSFEIMALSTTGSANILRPGQQETLEVKIKTPFRQANLPYQVVPIGAYPEIDGTNIAIDWNSLKADSRPETFDAGAWDVIWDNVALQTGSTWGDYVRMLGDNAAHLAQLGDMVYDRGRLFNFEVIQASSWNPNFFLASAVDASVTAPGLSLSLSRTFGQTIQSRFALGPFGRGWSLNYDLYLQETESGDMLMHGPTASFRLFSLNEDGSFTAGAGDYGVLSANGDGTFSLRETDGTILRFRSDFKLDSITDTNGNAIAAVYTAGLLSSLTHSSGQQITIDYNTNNRIERVTDQFGRETIYGYDPSGEHLISVTQYGDEVTLYDYVTEQGSAKQYALKFIQLPAGNNIFYDYDSQGRLIFEHIDNGEAPIAYSYDTSGTVTATDALNNESLLRYDANGILRQTVDPLGNVTQRNFDVNFNLVESVRADGLSTVFSYDQLGNVTNVIDVAGNPTVFGYDSTYNNLQFFTDARGNTTNYEYDTNGNLKAIINPAQLAETFEVDSFGNVKRSTNRRGNAIDYTFNADGRLTRKDFSDGSFVSYDYLEGNLVTMIDSTGTSTFVYEDDLLTLVTYPSGRFLDYDYVDGRRTGLLDQDGLLVSYSYDTAGRLKTLTDGDNNLLVDYGYDSRGLLDREDRGNGTFTTYLYDELGRVESITHHASDNSVTGFFNYTYDTLGRRTVASTHYGTWTYSYDLLGQLTGASLVCTNPRVADTNLVYEYDPVGNRIRTVTDGVITEYTVNNLNQYEQVGEDQYIYDDDGNLVMIVGPNNHREFVFDDENQLTRLTINGDTQQFNYDGIGNRVGVNAAGIQRELMYDPTGLSDLIADVNLTSATTTKFVHGFGLVAQLTDAGAQSYYVYDALGTTSQLFDAAGAIANEYFFGPFGQSLLSLETFSNDFTFIARWGIIDIGNHLYHMRARYFDAVIGRFTSADPLGLIGQDANFYRYVQNAPTAFVDPTGLSRCWGPQTDCSRLPPDEARNLPPIEWPAYKHDQFFDWLNENFDFDWWDPRDAGWHYPGIALLEICLLFPNLCKPGDGDRPGDDYNPDDPPTFCEIFPLLCAAFCNLFPFLCGESPNDPSFTPEDKFGPEGFDQPGTPDDQLQRYVTGDQKFNYRIDFWNEPTATVPTQDAIILDTLDPNLDWSTLNFTNFGFLNWNVDLPGGQVIDIQVDLRPEMNLAVNVEASFDQETGEIRWWFQAVDPATGDYPEDPFAGFLPPFNEITQFELGWVEYTIMPKNDLTTGARIENQAFVQFDMIGPFNPAPKPDPWLNTIDAGVPTSQVAPLSDPVNETSFLVEWSGTDDAGGSGIRAYDIYVSDNSGAFLRWQVNTTETEAMYDGQFGHTYAFYSIATDNVGNREGASATADASTTVVSINSDIISRVIFYNNSVYDGNDPTANTADDAAIDLTKVALLPGETAGSTNYSNSLFGINGIMIDLAGSTDASLITTDDFIFQVGNNNDPSSWLPAPIPTDLTVRLGEGFNGSDRITIIWPDGSIVNQWLQVTMMANPATTNLVVDEIHYWGNAIGEVDFSNNETTVDNNDRLAVLGNFDPGPVTIGNEYDINRDGIVDDKDLNLVTSFFTEYPNDLNLDGAVGLADLLIIKKNFGATGQDLSSLGDLNGDQIVNALDLQILLKNYGSKTDRLDADLNNDRIVDAEDLAIIDANIGHPLEDFGDFNSDGIVDGSDLAILLQQYGQTSVIISTDLNQDGKISLQDLLLLKKSFNKTLHDVGDLNRDQVIDASDRFLLELQQGKTNTSPYISPLELITPVVTTPQPAPENVAAAASASLSEILEEAILVPSRELLASSRNKSVRKTARNVRHASLKRAAAIDPAIAMLSQEYKETGKHDDTTKLLRARRHRKPSTHIQDNALLSVLDEKL